MRRSRNQHGFTLIEVMVVVAIIAIVSALLIGVSGSTYGANPRVFSDELVGTFSFAKMRSVSTRKRHEIEVAMGESPQRVRVWACTTTGFAACGTWALVSTVEVPNGVAIWGVDDTAACAAAGCSGAPGSASGATDLFEFKPDGSLDSGRTVFVTDTNTRHYFRVLIYGITGGSYARESW